MKKPQKNNDSIPFRIAFFSTKAWVRNSFNPVNERKTKLDLTFFEPKLDLDTASLAAGFKAICVFVNDLLDAPVLSKLSGLGVKLIALRCSGFNNVDIRKAHELGIAVVRVPAYSPYAVAEHTLGMILALNRRYHRSFTRVRDGNFSLDGLLGFDMHGKTVGIIGTGKIGQIFCNLLSGFGMTILAYDKYENDALKEKGVTYVDLETLYSKSDIISMHCPLTPETYHMINAYAIKFMKKGAMIINTSRGPLIDTDAVIDGLKSEQIGYLGLDVYEEEQDLFFEDLSGQVIQDDVFVRLLAFPNVLITAHQAFFTQEAVDNIAETTLLNIKDFIVEGSSKNAVLPA